MFWSGLYFKGRDMETQIEQKKTNSLAEWAKEGQGYSGYKTPMEEMAEQAIKSTQKAQYYNNLPAVQAIPEAQRQGVMDSYVSYFQNSQSLTQYYAQNRFMGYAFLSYLAQDAMISRGVHTLADEMTREWGELTTKEKENENVVQTVTDEMERLEVQNKFKEAALKTGFFGGCLIFLDVREDPNVPLEDIELEKPLFKEGMDDFNKSKLLNKHLVGLRVIEPINLAPGVYNSIDPTAADFFEPEHYYVLGRKIHRSRFLYFADNIPPQVLKPVYLFFGIPLAQLAFTYVQDFYKAKEVCTRILQKFSCSAISTDIEKLIYANGKNAVKDRISTIAKYRDNDSILVLDKENEEFSQTNTPLSGLKEMWYASLELIPVIFGVPATKLLEISPSGFNSTGEFEMRNFYDSVHTKQTNVFDAPMKRLVEIICYTKGLDPDILAWAWKSLFKMSERESAEVNRMEADTAQIYYNMGVVGNDDIAKRLINDKDSGYNNIQIPERIDPFQIGEDEPDLTEETEGNEGTEETKETEEISEVKDDAEVFDPFPSEHAARVKDPSEFEEGSFRRKNIANGVDIIIGKLKGSDKMEVQTYRFDKKVFTPEQAKEWLKSHKADNKMFEPAVKDETPKKGILSRILGIFDAFKEEEHPRSDDGKFKPKNGGGRGGSGKSKFEDEVYDKDKFLVLDADEIKKRIPEYAGWNAAEVHDESSDILDKALEYAKLNGVNVVLDATMKGLETSKKRLQQFKDAGYRTEAHYMYLPRQKSARRAVDRFLGAENGRYVPLKVLLGMKTNEQTFDVLKDMVDGWSFSDNDVERGEMPKLVAKSGKFSYKQGGPVWQTK